MFGIGGGELIFIIFIALMLFGSDKIPEIARTLGKIMAQLKNATNDIKSEIQKSAEVQEINESVKGLTSTFTDEVEKVKSNINEKVLPEVNKAAEDLDSLTGPIKRQM
ncbi:Sec-independent protein translocase subunit TatA/TatB [Flavobacterium terrisoli]|uniref:Sec-independent protein translocase subunit TatA/TatB n=1 Tax=Flavobacterium terrisoli TaxID=3242195 RepID=UPI002542DC16|nr:twin-arginine translocase TatA/TatE family subunit [Flavobacterium buctense]